MVGEETRRGSLPHVGRQSQVSGSWEDPDKTIDIPPKPGVALTQLTAGNKQNALGVLLLNRNPRKTAKHTDKMLNFLNILYFCQGLYSLVIQHSPARQLGSRFWVLSLNGDVRPHVHRMFNHS